MGVIADYFRRRMLRPVLRQLPHLLAKRYGAGVFYTAGQVRSATKVMKLDPKMVPAAFAIGCTASEFLGADPLFTEKNYRAEREEIARLFRIDERNLNCRFLTTSFRNPVSLDGGSNATGDNTPSDWP